MLTVRQPSFVHLEKQPLIPLVIRTVACRELTFPGITNPEALQLIFHMCDVVARPGFRMNVVLNRRILSGHTERVPTEWMQHVIAMHTLHPRNHVANHVIADMPNMSVARRIGKHHEAIKFWPRQILRDLKGTTVCPSLLPLFLDILGVIVAHGTNGRG
ncbi:MAG: hypothetical protein Ct9H300mP25_13160 [Acidobacteriota bacterium]|nr:MAG: hypothetical protein Ct9H300mP25_13160 [Acidobacteriota bacterium]